MIDRIRPHLQRVQQTFSLKGGVKFRSQLVLVHCRHFFKINQLVSRRGRMVNNHAYFCAAPFLLSLSIIMISDVQLAIFANVLGVTLFLMVVLYHYIVANNPKKSV